MYNHAMNELEIAKQIASGELPSPQKIPVSSTWLLDLRISGTGYAYREKSDSYVLRPESEYLTDDVLSMCNGLPVIVEHPENPADGVNSDSYTIGSVFYPYIKGNEIWGVCKIWNEQAIEAIEENDFSTSCSFRAGTQQIIIDDTEVKKDLSPQSANHVAILQENMGVWDKCNPDAISIITNNNTNTQEKPMSVVTDQTGDTENEGGSDFESKVLSILDTLVNSGEELKGRIEALESGGDQQLTPEPTLEPAPVEAKAEPAPVEPKPEDDAEMTLSDHANRIAALEGAGVKDDSEAEKEAEIMDDSQVLAGMLGTKVVKPFVGESSTSLKRRSLKSHVASLSELGVSHAWQGANIDVLDDSALSIAYSQTVGTMKGIQPKASAENPLRSFVKKGHGGLSNEIHYALADEAKGSYFNQY